MRPIWLLAIISLIVACTPDVPIESVSQPLEADPVSDLAEDIIEAVQSDDEDLFMSLIHPTVMAYYDVQNKTDLNLIVTRTLQQEFVDVQYIDNNLTALRGYNPETRVLTLGFNREANRSIEFFYVAPPERVLIITEGEVDRLRVGVARHGGRWFMTYPVPT